MTQPQFVPQIPTATTGYGFRTPFGVTLPPGGQVAAFVRSTGPQSNDDPAIAQNLMPTLAAGMSRVRTGLGDTIMVLPGHVENVVDNTFLASLLPGTRIIGCGTGSTMPTFTWTAAASQWILNQANVQVIGCRLNLGGFNGVTNAIAWTGADVALHECDIVTASSATLKATTCITVGVGADRGRITNTGFRGSVDLVTNGVLISGVVDSFTIMDSPMAFGATAANGLINITAAATNLFIGGGIRKMLMHNTGAASTACIAFGAAASTGSVQDVDCITENNGVVLSQGITLGATTLVRIFRCYGSDEPRTKGVELGTAPAT